MQFLHRHAMLLQACLTQPAEPLSEEELSVMLTVAGFRPNKGLLAGLPSWALKYVALLLMFVQHEREKLPEVMYKWEQNQRAGKKMGIRSSAPSYDVVRGGRFVGRTGAAGGVLDGVRCSLLSARNRTCV